MNNFFNNELFTVSSKKEEESININNLFPFGKENNNRNSYFHSLLLFPDQISFLEIIRVTNQKFEDITQKIKNLNREDNKKNDYIPNFITSKKGRVRLKDNFKKNDIRYVHGKFGTDNILRKIQIHYISFIIKYINHYIQTKISKDHPLFCDLEYSFKKNIKKSFFNELKTKTIGEIVKNKESYKNKKNGKLIILSNKEIFESINKKDEYIKMLLNTNYLDFFCNVYAYSLFHEDVNDYKPPDIPKGIQNFDYLIKQEESKENHDKNKSFQTKKPYIMKLKEITKMKYNYNNSNLKET